MDWPLLRLALLGEGAYSAVYKVEPQFPFPQLFGLESFFLGFTGMSSWQDFKQNHCCQVLRLADNEIYALKKATKGKDCLYKQNKQKLR